MPMEPVEMEGVLQRCFHDLREDIAAREAHVTIGPDLPTVRGHPTTLVQVFTNLISNAVKFGGERPGVHVWAETQERVARFWVEDQGIGIDPQHHDRIFRVFERLHGPERYPGTGIGLAIVRRGVERLGGRIGVQAQQGPGSRFWVELLLEDRP